MSGDNATSLRFGGLLRVSTVPQEQQGESLRTQRKAVARDVGLFRGTLVEGFGGAEHATEGWERRELLRLVEAARAGKINAVILAHVDRWDRGSKEAKEALEVFRERGVRFFVGVTEYDLFNPEHVLFLDL